MADPLLDVRENFRRLQIEKARAKDETVKAWMQSVGADPAAINDHYRDAFERSRANLEAMEAGRKAPEAPPPEPPLVYLRDVVTASRLQDPNTGTVHLYDPEKRPLAGMHPGPYLDLDFDLHEEGERPGPRPFDADEYERERFEDRYPDFGR